MTFFNRRRLFILGIVLLVMIFLPSYIRVFVLAGDSDAPAYENGDRVLVNFAAYDVRLPYADVRLAKMADPAPGDIVLFRFPDGRLVAKRVVAGPGALIAMQDNHLVIDGVALQYDTTAEQAVEISGGWPGTVVEIERGNGWEVYILFDREHGAPDDFEERVVPEGYYFVLGSNRDASLDSRHFGPLPRAWVQGKVISPERLTD